MSTGDMLSRVRTSPLTIIALALIVGFLLNAGFSLVVGLEVKNQVSKAVQAQAQQERNQDVLNRKQAEQQKAQALAEARRTCHDMGALKALVAPAGNPKSNPSRAFDQGQHAVYAQLYQDAGCDKL